MTITPHQLYLFSAPVVDLYRELEQDIFEQITKALIKKKNNKTLDNAGALEWQFQAMQELRLLNDWTINRLAQTTGVAERDIRNLIHDVGLETIKSVDSDLKGAVTPLPLPTPNTLDMKLEAFVNHTFRELDNYVNQTLITTNFGRSTVGRMYEQIVTETTAKVLNGQRTVNQAVIETVLEWRKRGIASGFVDKGGNLWSLPRYVETVVRSTVNNTYNQMRLERANDYGTTLMIVSSHPRARPACARIQGGIVDMERYPKQSKYPSIYEFGYGDADGVRGINCRHILFPYIEGVHTNTQPEYDEEEAIKGYEAEQRQRHLERAIREAKQNLRLAELSGVDEQITRFKKLVSNRQARIREHIKENDLPRFYNREQVF